MNRKTFKERLGKERLYWDGGTGSLLQAAGLRGGELPERWNLEHPDVVKGAARAYLEAGADIINTNTFGANRLHYPDPAELKSVIESGVRLAGEARSESGRPDAFIALDIGPTGRLLKPLGDLDFEEAVSIFGEIVKYGAGAGADLVLIETMSDSLEAKAALLAVKENSDLPVCVTMVFDSTGKLLTGGTPESAAVMLEGLGADAVGINCGTGPRQMAPLAERLLKISSLPVIINPNAGLPRTENGKTVYDLTADEFSDEMIPIAALGVHVLGGCCGTTPEYIRKEIEKTRDLPFAGPVKKHRTAVSSFSQTVFFGEKPVLIGERINPTGKKKLKEALKQKDFDYILQQGIEQEERGAEILDVNVGLPGIDEPAVMAETVTRLQGALALPLQIDTSDPAALERGLRIYNGKPMINSVTGKQESMDLVLPLAAKYGGVLVGLPLDENGIPDTAEGRLAIAKRIIDRAAEYGIDREDIIIDGLAMTVSAEPAAARVTLETVRRLKEELGVHTILGVSNVSFGLPRRELINASFFTLALGAGLSGAIMNPGSDMMMMSYRAFLALTEQDPQCAGYIRWCEENADAAPVLSAPAASRSPAPAGENRSRTAEKDIRESSLKDFVRHGMADRALSETARRITGGADPMSLVNEELIPALDAVGKGFESGRIFLPQLLMSAEAAKAAFEVIRDAMKGEVREAKGKIILATVKGDIHDIGKNIVKVLLENYGYEVIDLGKDVPAEVIVETACTSEVPLVGLSALMTTTVVSMEETIRLLKQSRPETRIVVGGAVMTKEYADQIGADFYAGEAMDTVRYADRVFSARE